MSYWLSIRVFAELVGVTHRTAQRWAREGRIRAHRTSGGHWRVWHTQLDRRPLTVTEVAARLGVSRRTVRDWAASGKLHARRVRNGGAWLVEPGEVARLEAVRNGAGAPVENEGGRTE